MNINHNHILSLLQTGFTTIAVTFDFNADANTDPVLRASEPVVGYRRQALHRGRQRAGIRCRGA